MCVELMHVMHSGCESLSEMDASHNVGQGREALPASLDSNPLVGTQAQTCKEELSVKARLAVTP